MSSLTQALKYASNPTSDSPLGVSFALRGNIYNVWRLDLLLLVVVGMMMTMMCFLFGVLFVVVFVIAIGVLWMEIKDAARFPIRFKTDAHKELSSLRWQWWEILAVDCFEEPLISKTGSFMEVTFFREWGSIQFLNTKNINIKIRKHMKDFEKQSTSYKVAYFSEIFGDMDFCLFL